MHNLFVNSNIYYQNSNEIAISNMTLISYQSPIYIKQIINYILEANPFKLIK